jgi:hypothetical protein
MSDLKRLLETLGSDEPGPAPPRSTLYAFSAPTTHASVANAEQFARVALASQTTDPRAIYSRLLSYARKAGWTVHDATAAVQRGDSRRQHQPSRKRQVVFLARGPTTAELFDATEVEWRQNTQRLMGPGIVCVTPPPAALLLRSGGQYLSIPSLEAFHEGAFQHFAGS